MASVNIFQAKNHQHIEIKWVRTGKERVVMGTEFSIVIRWTTVELLAYSMVCAADWPWFYTLDIMLGWVYDIISHCICNFTHFSNLNISGTNVDICKL